MNIEKINNLINYIINNYKIIKYDKIIKDFTEKDKQELYDKIKLKDLNNKKSYIGKEYIELKKHIIINIKFNNINIEINIYTYEDFNNDKLINNIVYRIYNMIQLFYKGDIKKLIIYMLLYNCPRVIPLTYNKSPNEMKDIIYENNLFNCVNGWVRYIDNYNEILITRLLTCEGLLIHELCHLCDLDFGGYNVFNEWDNYKKKYNINVKSKFTEGINNAISSIIHGIFNSIENKNNVKLYLDGEYYYSRDLVGNLLHYFKCKNIKELINKKCYNQISMMFEYIVIRYCYLKYINELYHLDNNFKDIDNKGYFNKFIKKLENIENENIEFNKNMIIKINNKISHYIRMEYYLL